MAYVYDSPANSNDFTLAAGTQQTDLPPSLRSANWWGTTSQPAISAVERSDPGITVTGLLNGISATADSLSGTFNHFVSFEDKASTAKFNREIQAAQVDLQRQQILGTLDLQRSQTAAQLQIEKNRAAVSVANDMAKINGGALNGTMAAPMLSMRMYVGLAILAGAYYLHSRGGLK
jgi:hypothetical protein